MASSRRWRAACRQFDSCAGSGGQASRCRERGSRGEREEELHRSSLALGNAYGCRLAAATTDVRVRLAASEHCDVVCAPRAAGEHENGYDARPTLKMKALGLSYRVLALPGGSTGLRRAPARKSKSRESSRAAAQTASPEALLARHGCVRTYGEVKGQGELENPSQNASKKKHPPYARASA